MPRLVPSFSSKGFVFFKEEGTGIIRSDVSNALAMTGPHISDSLLLSAYDIWHGYLDGPEQHYGNKELVVIDSGGYELSTDFDNTEPKQGPYTPDPAFGFDQYLEVLERLPRDRPLMIANFDHAARGKPVLDQIRMAQELFNDFPDFASNFIVKPATDRRTLDIDETIRHLDSMRRFSVIGVTEKELGTTLLERMKNIARLRLAMNRISLESPIHVWGGLDPVVTPLYFCAGAELFDGVSWLRYGYSNGVAIPRDAYHAIESDVQTQWRRAEALRLGRNVSHLEHMTVQMRRFVAQGREDYSVFAPAGEHVQRAIEILETEIPELRGGL